MGLKDLVKKMKKEDTFKKIESTEEHKVDENPMDKLTEETKTGHEEKTRYVVVKELPVQQVRSMKAEDGVTEIYVTIEEALQEMINQEDKE